MPTAQPGPWPQPRAFPRFLIDQRLLLKGETTLHGRTKDISEGGLGATVAGELNRKRPVLLEFYLPGSSTPIKIEAEIRYHQGFQYGFRFLHITDQQRALIHEAIQNLPPAP